MSLEGLAARHQVHDSLGQADHGRELNRPVQLDDLDRYPLLIEISLRDVRIFGRHPDLGGEPVAELPPPQRRDRKTARAEPQV
jgi:hypothetical protein